MLIVLIIVQIRIVKGTKRVKYAYSVDNSTNRIVKNSKRYKKSLTICL